MTTQQEYHLQTTDGSMLAATRFAPSSTTARAVVLIVPAMATRARSYRRLATWFAEQGIIAHTFDFRGYGASAQTPLSQVEADIFDWGADAGVVLKHLRSSEPELPLHWLGHSLGGQLLPMTKHRLLTSATILCSGTGYWGHSTGRNTVLAPLLWYGISPIFTRIFGYYPGRRLRILGDLPAPVMRQWTQWCKHPDYLLGTHPEFAERFSEVTTELTSVSFTDDETMPAAATAQLESWYTGTQAQLKRYHPAELGMTQIGHMGALREEKSAIWPQIFGHIIRHDDVSTAPRPAS